MKKHPLSRSLTLILILMVAVFAAGCGGKEPPVDEPVPVTPEAELGEPVEDTGEPAEPVADTGGGADIKDLLDTGALLANVYSASDYTAETGGGMSVEITNNTDDKIFVSIPCGMVFGPVDISYQEMMVIQEVTVEIDAGVTVTVDTTVICINANLTYPGAGTGYVVSGYVDDVNMLELAQCVCRQPIDMTISDNPFNFLSVQTAAWLVQDPEMAAGMEEFAGMAGDIADIAGDMAGTDSGVDTTGMVDMMMVSMTEGSQAVLDACMIELAEE